jgi:hypothetical protein
MTLYLEPNFPILVQGDFNKLRQFDKDLIGTLNVWSMTLKSILDGGISIDDNVDASLVSVVSHATPGSEFSVSHRLGKVPQGYIVTGQDGAGSVYDGSTTNTNAILYLKSDVSSKTFRLMVF